MNASGLLAGRSILVVEDEPLIALDVCDALREAGAELVAARTAYGALKQIRENAFAAAILDIHLGSGEDCEPICQELARRGIPFAFYTSYSHVPLTQDWPEAPLLCKPIQGALLIDKLKALMDRSAGRAP